MNKSKPEFDLLIEVSSPNADQEANSIEKLCSELESAGFGAPRLIGNSARIKLNAEIALEGLTLADSLGDTHFELTGDIVCAAIVRHSHEC